MECVIGYPNIQRLAEITPDVVKEFIKRCKREPLRGDKPLSESGVNQYLIDLQGIFATAIKEGWYTGEISVKVTWQQKRDKVATARYSSPRTPMPTCRRMTGISSGFEAEAVVTVAGSLGEKKEGDAVLFVEWCRDPSHALSGGCSPRLEASAGESNSTVPWI